MAVDATPSGVNANSYINEADADTYFDTRLSSTAWVDATATEQEAALIQSCMILDSYDFIGEPVTDTQALKWPRLVDDEMIRNFGGTLQVETATIVGTVTGSGDATVTVTAVGMTGSPIVLAVPVLNLDTASQVATKIRTALNANANIAAFFTIGGTGANITLTVITAAANDSTMNLAYDNGTCTGLTGDATSTDTTTGYLWANPTPIRNAQCEIALWLLQTGGSGVSISAAGIKSMKIGNSVEIQYETGTTTSAVIDTSIDPTGLPIQAARFLKGLRLYSVLA